MKIKFAFLTGGGGALQAEREIVQKTLVFLGMLKRHDNTNMKAQILLSRNLVVMAQSALVSLFTTSPRATTSAQMDI